MANKVIGRLAVALATTTVLAAPASALTINLNDIGGVTGSQAELGFAIAASYWEHAITSDTTVTFDVGFSALGDGILGGTETNIVQFVPISTYYDALGANAQSALDATSVANLAPLSANGSVSVTVPNYRNQGQHTGIATNGGRTAPDGTAITSTIGVASSTAKALGIDLTPSGLSSGSNADAEIQFSSTFAFDFDLTDGISSGEYDFIGVAIHEMGHALGFLSGADDFDYLAGNASNGVPVDSYWWGYAADLFRYTGDGQLNWRFNQPAYFSVDGGETAFLGDAYYSTGENHGDGWQASHWKAPGTCNNLVGIMNPYTCDGVGDIITAEDLGLFDAIGWNVGVDVLANPDYAYTTADVYHAYFDNPQPGVPEPATWAMMIAGFGLAGASLRRRKPTVSLRFG